MRSFYEDYFQAQAGELYHNPKKNFRSYFLSFETGCRLELMQKPDALSSNFFLDQVQVSSASPPAVQRTGSMRC